MKIFLAEGHISGKYQQYKDFEEMKIYLAGGNGKNSIIPAVKRKESMIIYLAGGIQGNLSPAWKKMQEITPDEFIRSLINEGFLSREHNIPSLYRSDIIRGGL